MLYLTVGQEYHYIVTGSARAVTGLTANNPALLSVDCLDLLPAVLSGFSEI